MKTIGLLQTEYCLQKAEKCPYMAERRAKADLCAENWSNVKGEGVKGSECCVQMQEQLTTAKAATASEASWVRGHILRLSRKVCWGFFFLLLTAQTR